MESMQVQLQFWKMHFTSGVFNFQMQEKMPVF